MYALITLFSMLKTMTGSNCWHTETLELTDCRVWWQIWINAAESNMPALRIFLKCVILYIC